MSDTLPTSQLDILKNPTLETVPNRSGPAIYDVSMEPSLNGVDPDYYKQDGVQKFPKAAKE